MIKTHGVFQLRCGRMATDYRPSERGPGMLALRLEVEDDDRRVEGHIRLDPWIGDEYGLIEFRAGNCLLVCGAQAVVAVDASDLTFRSSLGLEYQEGETLDVPWHTEGEEGRVLVLATERRVWCVDDRGTIRWSWSCSTSEQDRWISGEPVVENDRVRVPLRISNGELFVELRISDGLPTH